MSNYRTVSKTYLIIIGVPCCEVYMHKYIRTHFTSIHYKVICYRFIVLKILIIVLEFLVFNFTLNLISKGHFQLGRKIEPAPCFRGPSLT